MKIEKTGNLDLSNLRHAFDPEYFDRICREKEKIARRIVKFSRVEYVSDDVENNVGNVRAKQALHLSNHRSHFDYPQQASNLWKENFKAAMFAGRENVFINFLGLGDVWKKCGGFKLPFNKMNAEGARVFYHLIAEMLGNGESIFIYPEGGRSYSGDVGEFKIGGIKTICRAARNLGLDLTVFPHYITYDKPIERAFFPLLKKLKEKKWINAYVATDLFAFGLRYLTGHLYNRGEVLHVIGEPFSLKDCKYDAVEVGEIARKRIIAMRETNCLEKRLAACSSI